MAGLIKYMCLCTKIKCYLNVYVFLCFLIIMSMSVLVALALFHRVDCGCWACMSCVCKQRWHRRSYSHFSEYNKTLEYKSYSQAVVDLQLLGRIWERWPLYPPTPPSICLPIWTMIVGLRTIIQNKPFDI